MTRGRGYIAVLLIGALLATFGMQTATRLRRERIVPRPRAASRLSGLDSFALGLVLGGLRGPLVMALWTSTESQKNRRELEDIDTKIELIRMLQPEFDSVHLFQIWNKAYNLSVQMASLPNKYATILDALDYARSVDAERPDNLNIVFAIGDIYFHKLGESAEPERRYYIRQLRRDTLPHADSPRRGSDGWRRTRHDPLLDDKGFILPAFLAPRSPLAARSDYNGADLQYLERYNAPAAGGFRYGLPPSALGFNYYRRAAALAKATGQTHLQMSGEVVDSRPAVALRYWTEAEWARGREREIELFNRPLPDRRRDREAVTADIAPGSPIGDHSPAARSRLDDALFSYRRTAQVAAHAEEEYMRHLGNTSSILNAGVYATHIDTVRAIASIAKADHDYLMLLASGIGSKAAPSSDIEALRQSARKHYQEAIDRYYLLLLRYYTEDDVADAVYPVITEQLTGRRLDKYTIQEAAPSLYPRVHQAVRDYLKANRRMDANADDVDEYGKNISRCQQRLQLLKP